MTLILPPDRLTSQLYHVAGIVGRLGRSIADAQKELNADYLRNLKVLVAMTQRLLEGAGADEGGDQDGLVAAATSLLQQLAPSRYQYTETTIDFSADLSETFNAQGAVGVGAGFGAVVVNAALSVGFGYDYRAAARIKSVLHAIPSNEAMIGTFLTRAAAMDESRLNMPPLATVDVEQTNLVADLMSGLAKRDINRLPEPPAERAVGAAANAKRKADAAAKLAGQWKGEQDEEKKSRLGKRAKEAAAAAQAAADNAARAADEVEADENAEEAAQTATRKAADAAAADAKRAQEAVKDI